MTPIDLELDLAAQQSKLKLLQDEIDRLKAIKTRLEEAKVRGDKDLPNWFLEEERFQQMLSKFQSAEQSSLKKSREERRVEKMIRKTGRDIYRLRKAKLSRGQVDTHSFKEKMAFFTTVKSAEIPFLPSCFDSLENDDEDDDSCEDSEDDSCSITEDDRIPRSCLQAAAEDAELPVAESRNSTLKHGQVLPSLAASSAVTAGTNSVVTAKSPVTVTVNGQVQNFGCSGDRDVTGSNDTSSGCSTPTPTSSANQNHSKSYQERYDYEIDPDIGVIV